MASDHLPHALEGGSYHPLATPVGVVTGLCQRHLPAKWLKCEKSVVLPIYVREERLWSGTRAVEHGVGAALVRQGCLTC